MRIATILMVSFLLIFSAIGQTQRNPVLEVCTGTWCQWCPCGHDVIKNTILPNLPNAIILEYHGPANGTDPFSYFAGNSILSSLGFSAYPNGVVDRTTGTISRGSWYGQMNSRNAIPATVSISMSRSYDTNSRQFSASIDFTALQALNGQYNFNAILIEDGVVWGQTSNNTCTPGTTYHPNYVHHALVRDMMNGPLGELVINGAWSQGQVINKTVSYTVPVPSGGGPDIVPDSCSVVVLIYEVGSPLNSNAEIQQAIQEELVSPDYVARMENIGTDIIADNSTPADFNVVIYNNGLMDDTYAIDLSFTGSPDWTQEYTTINGTFSVGQTDSVQINSGDSSTITVSVNPNGYDGVGESELHFLSGNNPSTNGSILLRNVTTTGVDILVVDAENDGHETYTTNSLDNVYTGTYGMVGRTAFHDTSIVLDNFEIVNWVSAQSFPAFYPEEVTNLQTYLDNGGGLFISGQDIGSDIFEASGQSQFAQSFYNNYLHATYVNDAVTTYLINGYSGDPITNGISFVVTFTTGLSLEEISPYDTTASGILKYLNGPRVAAIKAATDNYRVVYSGIGFEQISDAADRDTILARSIRWLNADNASGVQDRPTLPREFALEQNYPNPFNPGTHIKYSLAKSSTVQLKIYNTIGQEIRTLVNNLSQTADQYSVYWDGKDKLGNLVTSGIYYYKLLANSSDQTFTQSKKMLLIK